TALWVRARQREDRPRRDDDVCARFGRESGERKGRDRLARQSRRLLFQLDSVPPALLRAIKRGVRARDRSEWIVLALTDRGDAETRRHHHLSVVPGHRMFG